MKRRIRCFPPASGTDAKLLILGSMPGEASLRKSQYYGHPMNAFWRIMGEIIGFPPDAPYEVRLSKLIGAKMALWDVLETCVRPGSMDSDIADGRPNKFKEFFKSHTGIRRIVFNGSTAERLFRRHVDCAPPGASFVRAPSTSPANASIKYSAKLSAWREALSINAIDMKERL